MKDLGFVMTIGILALIATIATVVEVTGTHKEAQAMLRRLDAHKEFNQAPWCGRKGNKEMTRFELAWVETGKPERELALEYGMTRVMIIPEGTDRRIVEFLVEKANERIEGECHY